MFRIGEFSKLTQVSIRMLRYYDEANLLKPAEVDPWTGHRFYSAAQIPRLNRIVYLRDCGFHVSEISRALEMNDGEFLRCLENKRIEIEQTIVSAQERLLKLETAKHELLGERRELHYNISIKSIPEYRVLSLRRIVPTYYSEGDLWNELCAFVKTHKIELTGSTFTICHDTDFREQDVDIELCAHVSRMYENRAPFRFRVVEAVPVMACTMVYGNFSNIKGAYLAFAEWLQENRSYRMSCPMRQIVHRGPWNEREPQQYLTELQIPLELE